MRELTNIKGDPVIFDYSALVLVNVHVIWSRKYSHQGGKIAFWHFGVKSVPEILSFMAPNHAQQSISIEETFYSVKIESERATTRGSLVLTIIC